MKRVGQELTGLFRGRIGADGIVHHVVLGEERILATTVHTARTGKAEVLALILSRQFQQSSRPFNIRVNVNVGVLNRRPDTSSGRHVADPLDFVFLENALHEILVANVARVNRQATFTVLTTKQIKGTMMMQN